MANNFVHFPYGAPKLTRRQEILRAASELFSKNGVQAVTTRQIAAEVGISQPSLYAHFSSVHEIHQELSSKAFELLELKTVQAEKEGLTQEELLRATIKNYFEFGLENPVAYKIAFLIEYEKDQGLTQDEYDSINHPGVRAFKNLRSTLAKVRPDLDEANLQILSKLLWATLHGLVSLLVMRSHFPWGDQDELIELQSKAAFAFVMQFQTAP